MYRKLFVLALLALVVFAAGAVSAQEKVLTVGITQEPDGFGPMATMVAGTTVQAMLSPTAAHERTGDWDLRATQFLQVPNVGDGSWVVRDDETMVVHFQLRDDLYWHDGEKVTAEDFKFGWEVQRDERVPMPTRTVVNYQSEFEIINDYEFKLHYDNLYPFADQVLGFEAVPVHILGDVYEENIDAFINNAYWSTEFIGYGAYKIEEWVPGSHIELVKWDPWFRGHNIDRIYVRFVTDTEALRVMIRLGEVDVSLPPTVAFDEAYALQQEADPEEVYVHFMPGTVWEHVDMNVRDFEPFRDVRVRQALLHGIDREEIVDVLFMGVNEVSHQPYAPRHPLFTAEAEEEMTVYDYNPERARQLLHEAGFEPDAEGIMTHTETGERLVLNWRTTAGNRNRELVQQIVAENWKEIGVETEIENMTALFGDHLYRREFPHLILFAWSSFPTSLGDTLWHSRYIPTEENGWVGQNVAGYVNPEVDDLYDEMTVTMDPNRRAEIAAEVIKHWTADVASLPLFFRVEPYTWRTNVTGIDPTGSADPTSWNIYEWDIVD